MNKAKEKLIIDYINYRKKEMEDNNIRLKDNVFLELKEKYSKSAEDINTIYYKIDKDLEQILKEKYSINNFKFKKIDNIGSKDNIKNTCVKISRVQIDLMNIARSNNIVDLQRSISSIGRVKLDINKMKYNNFSELRQEVFNKYKESLNDNEKNDINPNIDFYNKLNKVLLSNDLTIDEKLIINDIVDNNIDIGSIKNEIKNNFSLDKQNIIFGGFDDKDLEKEKRLKDSTINDYQNLYRDIKYSDDLLKIDMDDKYKEDEYNDSMENYNLVNTELDFAKEVGKNVIIGGIISKNMIINLDKSNSKTIKDDLKKYVNSLTEAIKEYEKENGKVVDTIDIFENVSNSNLLSYLSVNDLCEIGEIAKKNLPDVKLRLIDNKESLQGTEFINDIRKYEEDRDVRIVDSISEEVKDTTNNINDLTYTNLPIEVTNYTNDFTSEELIKYNLNDKQEEEKKNKEEQEEKKEKKEKKEDSINEKDSLSNEINEMLIENQEEKQEKKEDIKLDETVKDKPKVLTKKKPNKEDGYVKNITLILTIFVSLLIVLFIYLMINIM